MLAHDLIRFVFLAGFSCLFASMGWANSAPTDINASNLTIAENSAIGTVVGEFNATDPDGDTNIIFRILPDPPDGFSPLLWLDASDSSTITHSSGSVSQWADKSGNDYHAHQSTLTKQPQFLQNSISGNPAIFFDGSDDSLVSYTRLGLPANPAITIFVVCKPMQHGSGETRILKIGAGNYALSVGAGSSGWAWRYNGGFETYLNVGLNSQYVLAYVRPNGGNFASGRFFLNGVEQSRKDGGGDTLYPSNTHTLYSIGSNDGGNYALFNGLIGEIIVSNSDSVANRQAIEGFIAKKWGLGGNLPSNHPRKNYPSNFGVGSNGTLITNQIFDYETDDLNYTITVRAKDDHNAFFDKNFTISITNVVEDLDGDGTEDHYDDDIDGDGLTNAEELAYNSDPWDASSSNRPPNDINTTSNLTIAENSEIGTVIGEFNATDPDGEGNFSFSLPSAIAFYSIDTNGTLKVSGLIDYETYDSNFSFIVRVLDDRNASFDKNFTITVTNVVEDLDGDSTEDHYDDDIDGDGLSNAEELAYNSDPWDASSINRPPSDINASNLTIAENSAIGTVIGEFNATDPDGEGNFTYAMHSDSLAIWLSFDEVNGTTTQNYGSFSTDINLLNGASFSSSEKKFGSSSVRIPLSSAKSRFEFSNPFPLGNTESSNDYSVSVWFKGLYNFNETNSGWRTLTRGSSSNHHIIVNKESDELGTHRNAWYGSGQTLNPADSKENWQHLVATFNGSTAKFFIDGTFLSSVAKSSGLDIKSVGNYQGGDQHFAEYLDDFRVYSKVLSESEISSLYLSPFSIDSNGSLTANQTFDYETDDRNYSITVRATDDHNVSFDKNFTVTLANVVEDLDGDGTEDHYDDDIDGDGLTNAEELAYNSDPWDASSSNRPPSDINASNLAIAENSAIGTVIGEFNATDPDGDTNITFLLTGESLPFGWTSTHLTGDEDSGVSSGYNYTCSVNVNGSNKTVNGVTFIGSTATSGSGWEITGGFSSTYNGENSTVGGQMGSLLSDGFRFDGNPQKLKLTGLTVGRIYVFSLYNQAWGAGTSRISKISSTFFEEVVSINQDKFGGQSQDGHLVRCKYTANASEVEFSLTRDGSAGSWHLYAFSNHEVIPFALDENGTLSTLKSFDYETDDRNYSITVRATDDHNISFDKNFTITVTNVVEDLDGDGTEDHYDDDIDGDGLTNAEELLYNSDPWDASSSNRPPSDINASNLTIAENSAIGTVIGEFNATDPDGEGNFTYDLKFNFPESSNPVFWMDASDSSTITQSSGFVSHWLDKSGNENHLIQGNTSMQGRFVPTAINNMPSIFFDGGNDNYKFQKSLAIQSIFMVLNTTETPRFTNWRWPFGGKTTNSNRYAFIFGKKDSANLVGNNLSLNGGISAGELSFANDQSFKIIYCYKGDPVVRSDWYIGLGDAYWKGHISEVISFSNLLSENLVDQVEAYLGFKWGLESNLPNENPAKTFSVDTNGTLTANQIFDYETDDRNYSITVRATDDHNISFDKNFTITVSNVVEDLDGDGTEDHYDDDVDGDGLSNTEELAYNSDPWDASSSNRPPSDINASNLTIAENSAIGTVIGEFNATDPDGEGNFTFTVASIIKQPNFFPEILPELTAWFDASDTDTLITTHGGNELVSWANKVNPRIKLFGAQSRSPTTGASINQLNAIKFDESSGVTELVELDNWNPATKDGSISGDVVDLSIFLAMRVDQNARSNFPFGFGWGDHLFWETGKIYWKNTETRQNANVATNGERFVLNLDFSVTRGTQRVFKNGVELFSGPRTETTKVDHSFHFPSSAGGGTGQYLQKWTVGEVLVSRSMVSDELRQRTEGYLTHKWGLVESLPTSHLFSQNRSVELTDLLVSIDENGTLSTRSVPNYEADKNYTITVRATDDHNISFDKNFTITVTNVVEDLDGDGTEDHYDLDDDGDGLSDLDEAHFNSDPRDANSPTDPATSFVISQELSISEDAEIGAVVGKFSELEDSASPIKSYELIPHLPTSANPVLWLDASDLDYADETWQDKSLSNNHATRNGSAQGFPTILKNYQNGLAVMHYSGSKNNYHEFNEINDIRTVFWVVGRSSGFMLGHKISHHFHQWANGLFANNGWASKSITEGDLFFGGHEVDGSTNSPSRSLSVVSLRTSGNVNADSFSKDRDFEWSVFNGELGELLIYDQALSDLQLKEVEQYLSLKWALPLKYPNAEFSIDENGTVRTLAKSDYEIGSERKILVRATNENNQSVENLFTISISNAFDDIDGDGISDTTDSDIDGDGLSNEYEEEHGFDPYDPLSKNYAPTDIVPSSSLSVSEKAKVGSIINTFTASDPDTGAEHEFYLATGKGDAGNAVFNLSDTGNLKLAKVLNYDLATEYSIRVRVIDEHNASFEKVLSISVINVIEDIDGDGIEDQFDSDDDGDGIPDESDPDRDGDGLSNAEEITNGSNPIDPNSVNYPASSISSVDGLKIVENSAIGSLVGQLRAIDPDDGSTHQYELVENNSYPANELFSLSVEGFLRAETIFNYESNASSYEIRVKASDEYNASSVHTLTVELIDDPLLSPYNLNISPMLWLDASDSSLMDTGFELVDNIPSNGQQVGFWKDKSERGYNAIAKNLLEYEDRKPVYSTTGFNGGEMPYLHFTNDSMFIENSEEDFDGWSTFSVFATLKPSKQNWASNFGKIKSTTDVAWVFITRRVDFNPPWYAFAMRDTTADDYIDAKSDVFFKPGIIYLRYGGGRRQLHYNGEKLFDTADGGTPQLLPDIPVTLGSPPGLQNGSSMQLGEFLIFNSLLTDEDRFKLEGYLAHKWQITGKIPSTHPYKKVYPTDQSFIIAENMGVGSSLGSVSSVIANYDSSHDYSLAESNSTNDNQYFTLSSTGILKNAQLFDYESNQSEYTIGFVAKNSDGAVVSTINQTVYLINEVEDFDEDGIEDAFDPDDDDDGYSDIAEIAYGSNPRDGQSVANASPTDISSPVSLSIIENAPVGAEVGKLIVSDDDTNDSHRFDVLYSYPEGLSPAIWYDPSDNAKVTVSSGVVTSVSDKSANGYNLSPIGDPTLVEYLGMNVLDLDGDDLLYASKEWKRTGEFTFFAVARYSGDKRGRVISDRDWDSNWLFGLHSGGIGKYGFNGWLSHGTSGDEKFHLLAADMNSFDRGNTWLDGKKTLTNGSGAGSEYEPVRLQFGGWRDNKTEMSTCQIAEFVGFNSVLPPDQNAEVQAYLSSKWGVGSVNIEDTSYRFSIDNNGTVVTNMPFDYEDDQNHTIRVRVIDQGDEFIEKDFVVSITDVLEDLDGDGVEDHLDTDVDGDGASNSLEIAGRSDPLDRNSTNQQPNGLTATESLTLAESTSLGMEINRFTGNDSDSGTNFSYSLVSRLDGLKPVLWLDATNEDSIKHVGGDVYEWKDLSENGHHVYQPEPNRRPSSRNSSHINELNVISFNRSHSDYLYTQKPLRANWQDIYVVGKWEGSENTFPNWAGLITSHGEFDSGRGIGLVGRIGQAGYFKDLATNEGWWDNLYVNGATNDGSNILTQSKTPFLHSISSEKPLSVTGLSIGTHRHYDIRHWNGFIGEVIIFERKLNTAERQTAENYLAAKWGIAVGRSVVPLSNDLFKLDENGSLELIESLDFEESDKHLIRVRVTDDWNASFEKEFQITVTDVFEDADSDGTEDHLDDDADGDGISNIVEIEVGTDPLDANSKNRAPNNISSTTSLTVAEDLEIGAVVSAFTASDPDVGQSHRFTLVPTEQIRLSPQFWLDANKSSSIDLNGARVMNWSDDRNGRKMIQDESDNQPYLNNRELNDMPVVEFGGNSFLYSYGSFDLYENASIFMVAGIDGVDHTNDSIISYNSSSSGSKFQLEAGSSEGFLARLNSSGAFGQDKTFLNSAEHEPSLYEIIFNNSNGSIEVLVDGESFGHSSYKNPLNGRHVLRLFANRGLDVFASGFVAEFMVFEEALSEVDRKLVESYLGEKWALPMHDPIEHPLFKMEQNGTLVTREELDFETDENHTITVRVFDEYNATYDKDFLVSVTNIVEDLDGDGIENHYDTDDDNDSIPDDLDPDDDNDGFSDADEIAYGADPLDPNSVPNSAPVDLNASNVLTIYENQPVGTSIGEFNATDPDGDNIIYHFVSGENNNSFFTLDTNGTLKSAVTFDYESNASTYTISVQAKDELNASVEGNFTITLLDVDDEKPVIELAGDSNITHEAGSFYTDQNATWADNVDGDGNLTGTGEVNASNPGIYYLTFNYTDDAGNVAQTVTRTVNVVDTTAPIILLNGDSNITHEAGTAYHDANATWTDAVDGEGIIYGVGDVNVSKPGIYYLTFDFTDQAGNAAETVTRTVNVLDRIAPEISLNGENEITHEAGTAYEDANATWTDAVDGSGNITGTGEVNASKPGIYYLTFNYTDDAGNVSATVTRTVNVVDTTAPIILLNGDSSITLEAGTAYFDANATWSDAVDGSGVISAVGEVDTSTPGTYILSFDYTDAAGNAAQTVRRTINVVDTTAPVISLNGDSNITHEAGAPYEDANATWTDAVYGSGIIHAQGEVDASIPGTYYLTFNYTDDSGNAAQTVARTINVVDTTAPVITLIGDSNITHEAGTAYHDANATWTDAVDGQGVVYGVGDANVSKPGIYYLTFDYSDQAGNAAQTVTRTINVVDRTAPVITLNGDSNITHEAGTAYIDANATWTDAVDGSGIIHAKGEVDNTKPGTYILGYDYTDEAGNVAQTVTRTINVVDTTAPVITLRGPASISQLVGSDYIDAGATWYDVVDGEGEAQVTGEVLADILGTYELIYSHTDQAGNHAVKVKRIVQVVNTPPTELVSQSPLSVLENQPVGTLVGSFTSQSDNINSRLVYRLVEGDTLEDSSFTLDENGTLQTARVFDFETDAKEYEIEVEVADQFGASQSKSFTVDLVNIIEDLDGDGIEDFYDDDIDGDGFSNETELAEGTDPRDPFSASMQPILKTISGYLDRNGSIILRGRVEADGDGAITDFGFVLSSKVVMSRSAGKDIWIRGEGNASNFTLRVDENPFDGDLYFRAWAKNVAGYGVGSVKKVIFEMEPAGWWGQTEEFDGGWQVSPWFGAFRAYEEGWLYHARLGWLYSKEAPEKSVWLWQENRGWLWTQEEIWPYLWSNRSSDWIYLFPSKAGEPVYLFDQATGTAEPLK